MSLTTQYNKSYLMFVPNVKVLAVGVPEKSLTKFNQRKRKKKINEVNDKQEEADSFLHKTTSHT